MPWLSMWARLGVVLTGVWMIGATWAFSGIQWDQFTTPGRLIYLACLDEYTGTRPDLVKQCSDNYDSMINRAQAMEWSFWGWSFLYALACVVAIWFVVGIGILLAKWILAGRRAVQ